MSDCCGDKTKCSSIIFMYTELEKSCEEIGRAYSVSARTIQRLLKKHNAIRTKRESYIIAIKRGRMTYDHLRKDIRKADLRKSINRRLRIGILTRDNFTCQTCGAKAPDVRLQIDHKDCDVANNDSNNLWTMCIDCNQGKKDYTLSEIKEWSLS